MNRTVADDSGRDPRLTIPGRTMIARYQREWLSRDLVAGLVLTALLVGFVVKTMDIYITSLGKTALAVALLASGMYGVFQLQVTSAFTAFLTGGLVLIPLLVFASQALVNDLSRGRIQWQR